MVKVLKFGGTSLGDANRIKNVARIIEEAARECTQSIIVLSAMVGVTDMLLEAAHEATSNSDKAQSILDLLCQKYESGFHEVMLDLNTKKQVEEITTELKDIIKGISFVRECSPRTLDFVLSFGERLCAFLMSLLLQKKGIAAEFVDARNVIVTDDNHGRAGVDTHETNIRLKKAMKDDKTYVVTGYIGATPGGVTTTLGRGGSDYTASLIGAALKVDRIEIWTDVDGFMSADPRLIKEAFVLPRVSYEEAMEMSYFGAKVIHPQTIHPAVVEDIPVLIKNSFHPERPGTVITKSSDDSDFPVKGIASFGGISLLNLQGSGMVGVPGVASRLFGTLAKNKINVIMISQASSEHSICFAIRTQDAELARKALSEEFESEIITGKIDKIIKNDNLTIVAAVGDNMKGTPGIAGKLFDSLGKNSINVIAIAQGSSERNVSLIVNSQNAEKSVSVIHSAFYLSKTVANLFVIGVGSIGSVLLKQIQEEKEELLQRKGLQLNICGVADVNKMVVDEHGIDLSKWKELLQASVNKTSIDEILKRLKSFRLVNTIIVDCTAADEISRRYPEFLRAGLHIVTPNKKANTMEQSYYDELKKLTKDHRLHYRYEATVGAGLPVISTLQNLIYSGDDIIKIEGILSGTLSYIFNNLATGKPFSRIVRDAYDNGFTEPDPRDDLSGLDVARKILILARESGHKLELGDVQLTPVLPEHYMEGNLETFWKKLPVEDAKFKQMHEHATANGNRLRYIAAFNEGVCKVGIREIPSDHLLSKASTTDNIVQITTKRYFESPLTVHGPGAGREVTAGGIFADIISLALHLA
jgi:aspartokinase/homoserine dehydrogenase 1